MIVLFYYPTGVMGRAAGSIQVRKLFLFALLFLEFVFNLGYKISKVNVWQ